MRFKFSAMILAAGYGKRMLPLTKDIPKPLIEVNGITLLDNSINFLKKLGCDQIIINSHYLYHKIEAAVESRITKDNITLIYEKEILNTGGGVKNALPFLKNKDLLIINSDVFWRNENLIDVFSLIKNYQKNFFPNLLLVNNKNAFGIKKTKGDFILNKNKILRSKNDDKIIFYTGLQILKVDIFKEFTLDSFSFNIIWDFYIKKNKLCGQIMHSNWYHVGDIQSLIIVRELVS